jgi:hypothetical protein
MIRIEQEEREIDRLVKEAGVSQGYTPKKRTPDMANKELRALIDPGPLPSDMEPTKQPTKQIDPREPYVDCPEPAWPEPEPEFEENYPAPTCRPGHPKFYEYLEIMATIHAQKNLDYGNGNPLGNFMEAEKLGVTPFKGILIRMSDKWSRICSLVNSGEQHVKDESLIDTLVDLANYAILACVLLEEEEG